MEQFLFGLYRDGKYRLSKSPGVNRLLSDGNIQYLRQQQSTHAKPFWLPTEQVVAIQYITHVQDTTGRHGVWNHTLLVPIDEYIRVTFSMLPVTDHFITTEDHVPTPLPSVTL